MKTNVGFLSNVRRPLRSFLFLVLFGLISFGFMTKAVGFILIQRETGVLGSYYRSIGILQNIKDPQAGDISAGAALIETSPYFAYGDQRQIVSGVMSQIYNENLITSDSTRVWEAYPEEYWAKTYTYDLWFIGPLLDVEEIKTQAKNPEDQRTVGYYLQFHVDILLASDPQYAEQDKTVALLFLFEGHEDAIPTIQAMKVGQRYFIRGWDDFTANKVEFTWENTHFASLEIKPLNDQLWYIPLASGESADLSNPALAPFKNKIDVLNENLHTLNIYATADQSAMPKMQAASREYYLTDGRWLNHQDDLSKNKVIVVTESFATLRHLKLGDRIPLTFRPLKDTYFGEIRDGVDAQNWRSYPTYQDTFEIVGTYTSTKGWAFFAFIPTSTLRPGFASLTQPQFRYDDGYSFVLDSTRDEPAFIEAFKDPLQQLGISLTFLANNGTAYWAAVDPIRRSLASDLLVYGLLLVVTFVLAVFLYVLARRRDYAILRALGVPAKQANWQTVWPLLLLGGIGISLGGFPAWGYAISRAKDSLSSLPLPSGVTPSAHLSLSVLAGLGAAVFLFLAGFTWLGVFLLSRKPVFELLQGETSRSRGRRQKPARTRASSEPGPALAVSTPGAIDHAGSQRKEHPVSQVDLAARRKYTPASLGGYVFHHILRSWLSPCLTMVVALGFILASAWIRQTIERSRLQVEQLYDTTIVQADILQTDHSAGSNEGTAGTGFVYLNAVNSILNSGFVKSSVLEADTVWFKIAPYDSENSYPGHYPVYAYDSPEAFQSSLAEPGSLVFAPGWDMNRFAEPRTRVEIQDMGLAAIFPASLLEQLQVTIGETVRITDSTSHGYSCTIVGQYSGGPNILIPLSALEAMDGSQAKFTRAHFSLDPARNRDLDQLRAEMEKPMAAYGGKVRFMIWDEELKLVVAQLEKSISLLQVLYPVLLAVSVLIGAGLCFLLLLQAAREAAILRVLGTTRTAVRLALLIEPFFLSILGVSLGLGVARLLWTTPAVGSSFPLMITAGLYLAGVLAGSVMGAISVTNKKPIELLQVKE